MRLLSFDTSTSCLSVAICENGQVLAEANLDPGPLAKGDRQESVSLLVPTIDELTGKLGMKKQEFGAIAIGVGPGGFTGVRVSVVTGRTLAQALGLPLVGINSLETASYGEPSLAGVGVAKVASKTHCFVARYGRVPWEGDLYDLAMLSRPACISFEEFGRQLSLDQNCGWMIEEPLASCFEQFGKQLSVYASVKNVAAIQAKIAHVRLSLKAAAEGEKQNNFPYQQVQPLYLRGASVTLKKGDVIERVETY